MQIEALRRLLEHTEKKLEDMELRRMVDRVKVVASEKIARSPLHARALACGLFSHSLAGCMSLGSEEAICTCVPPPPSPWVTYFGCRVSKKKSRFVE